MGRWTSPRMLIILLAALLISPILPIIDNEAEGSAPPRTDPRYDSIVVIDRSSIRFTSGGITQWGPYCFGVVNRTTVIEVRLMNTNNAPIIGIEVNFTMYWYDASKGDSFDKGRVLHRDSSQASVGSGEGTLSNPIKFYWVPQFAGAYIMNISIKVPGDPRSFSDRSLAAGIQYNTHGGTITDGLWVATEFWNFSTMDGWTSYSDQGEPGVQWHVSDHPLSQGYGNLHTTGGSIWVGYEGTGLSPTNGSYSLVSPVLNLSRFNPEGWDYYLEDRIPQIYLLYKYRGNISEEGPSGGGSLYHWVRIKEDGSWGAWEPLMDPKSNWVNLTGNTSNAIWELSRRPYKYGDLDFIGIDLGEYQGSDVQVRLEYLPSGVQETGYVIDDILIIGKEAVDVTPFLVKADTDNVLDADPGSDVKFGIELISKLKPTDKDVSARIEVIDGSDFLEIDRDISIEPGIINLPKILDEQVDSRIILSIPPSAPSGDGWIKLRVLGGGIVKDITFKFNVNSRRKLGMEVTGQTSGYIAPDEKRTVHVIVENQGNVGEEVSLSFLTDEDLDTDSGFGTRYLEPGESWMTTVNLSIGQQSESGIKRGFFLLSRSPPPADALASIISGDLRPDWQVFEAKYDVDQKYSIELIAPSLASTYREIEEPKENGTEIIDYHLVIRNNGNGIDRVTLVSPDWEWKEDVVLELPENISIRSGTTDFIKVTIRIMYPVPLGIYDFKILAISQGEEDVSDNIVDLTLSIGRAPVSSGIYLLNGSLDVRPSELVIGRDAKVFFTVRSFGFLDSEGFNVNLWLNGKVVLTKWFDITRYSDRICEIPLSFDRPGSYILNISLSEGKDLGPAITDLVITMSKTIDVGFIDIGVKNLYILRYDERVDTDDIRPGDHDISVDIENNGDTTALLVVVTLTIEDLNQGTSSNVILNITDIAPKEIKELSFKNVIFSSERVYQITVSIETSERWRDTDPENDLGQMDVMVGSIPPDIPIWREPIWGIIGFVIILMVTVVLLFYMLRKKLWP